MNNSEYFERAKKVTPGGVHSPVRSFKGLKTTPNFVNKSQGAKFYDEEGKEFIDFCMSFGPLILGHSNPRVKEEIIKAVEQGWSYGACEKYSLELAEYMVERISFIDKVRFVNSGTEAVMTALRLARGITGKSKIIKFNGCYHGHVDSMLIKAGSGLAGTAEASSAGITPGCARDTLIVELNNLEEVEACFSDHDDIAGIIIEPLPANNGLMPQDLTFLQGLRDLCDKHSALLIFDEVISGFRISFSGMAGVTNISPDIVTYGKVIGAGMPVGAIAGKSSIMDHLAPLGNVYQAGTLSANPVAMRAGLTVLKEISQKGFYNSLTEKTQKIIALFQRKLTQSFPSYEIINMGSLFWLKPTNNPIKSIQDVPNDIMEPFVPLMDDMLNRGIYLSPNPYEIAFVSSAHDNQVINELEERLWS